MNNHTIHSHHFIPSKHWPKLMLIVGIGMVTSPANAGSSSIETAGDIVMVAIPAAAYGSTYYMDDEAGRQQFYTAFAANVVATYGLKELVDKDRPDHSDNDSFPSGHTSIAFQGASFIHKRYGFEYSIPAYLGASFVGYSRVEADKHHTSDVIAGAALGMASSMFLTKHYYDDNLLISANLAPESYQVSLHYKF